LIKLSNEMHVQTNKVDRNLSVRRSIQIPAYEKNCENLQINTKSKSAPTLPRRLMLLMILIYHTKAFLVYPIYTHRPSKWQLIQASSYEKKLFHQDESKVTLFQIHGNILSNLCKVHKNYAQCEKSMKKLKLNKIKSHPMKLRAGI